jgi:hypothetical protein
VPGDATAWSRALHALSIGGVSTQSFQSPDPLRHVTLSGTKRWAAFSGASGIVIGPLRRIRLSKGAMLGGEDKDDIHSRIEKLHSRLKEDYSVRWEIDTYLLAVYFYPKSKPPKWTVLNIDDTYHYHNLPDLMHIVRQTLIGLCCSAWLQRLFNIFLCGKRYRRLTHTNNDNVQLTAAVINTLHGLLLGLYPFNERRSDLRRRAFIAGSLHNVLTGGKHADFIAAHTNLLCLSLVEYVLNVVHDFCPVEWSLLGITTGAKSQCLAAIESFRESSVNQHANGQDTAEFWAKLDADAQPVISILVKFFRDATLYQHRPRSILPTGMLRHLPLAMHSHVIQNSSSIFGQLKCALPNIQFPESEALEEIWTSIYMRQLPSHTTAKQMEVLGRMGRMCHLVEHELHHFPMCMACALTRRADVLKALFRFDSVDQRLICNECMDHKHVVNINMLGRVLYVRDKVLVLCEQCLRPKHWDSACACTLNDAVAVNTCCVCNNANTVSSKEIIDIGRFCMQSVQFCYKHSLSCVLSNATVYDRNALELELKSRSTMGKTNSTQ